MEYIIENGNVFADYGKARVHVGLVEKTETIRIDSETVADVVYLFDLDAGQYVEQSRTERAEPLPPPEPSPADRIAQLEEENALLALELAQTQIRLDQAEQEQAELLLTLVSEGVI